MHIPPPDPGCRRGRDGGPDPVVGEAADDTSLRLIGVGRRGQDERHAQDREQQRQQHGGQHEDGQPLLL